MNNNICSNVFVVHNWHLQVGVKCVRRTHRKTSSRSMFDISSIGNLVDDGNVTLQATSGKKEKGPKLYFFVRSAREKERWFHLSVYS